MSKTFLGFLAAIIIVFAGVFFINHNNQSTASGGSNNIAASEHIIGQDSSGVKLVEYGDYECPYCEEYYPVVQQVVKDEFSKISFQFRNYPLTSIHPNAFAGARAAEAAALMGKFWQMHDALYNSSNWQKWSTASNPTPYFTQYASELGLNLTTFKADFASSRVNNTIQADLTAGNKLNIQGTPTFYLDGKLMQVGPSVSQFEKLINQAIANQGNAVKPTASNKTIQSKK